MCVENVKVNGADCINVTVTPISNDKADEFLNKFSDKPLTEDPEKEKIAKEKLNKFIKYFKSDAFEKDVNRQAYKTGKAPREVAKNAITKAFGLVGDILGIAVDTVDCTLHGLINLLSVALHSAVSLITRIVDGLCRIVTFNQTCCRV